MLALREAGIFSWHQIVTESGGGKLLEFSTAVIIVQLSVIFGQLWKTQYDTK